MSKLLWNALKVSPALLGASLLLASSVHAASDPTTQIVSKETATAATSEPAASRETTVNLNSQLLQTQEKPISVSGLNLTETNSSASELNASKINSPTLNLAKNNPAEPNLATTTPQTSVDSASKVELTPTDTHPPLNKADTTLAQQVPAAGNTPANSSNVLDQVERYNNSNEGNDSGALDQVTNVTQLSDVRPTDWAYEALRSLVERYGCIQGYPDRTFRGNRATTRYEFAAGLNACLNQIERLIASSTADFVRRQDLETLQRLVDEFRSELTTLGARVDKLDGRVAFLENHQFSTTTKLVGEAIFNITQAGGDRIAVAKGRSNDDLDFNTVFTDRIRLNLNTSFTGNDLLRTRLQIGNTRGFFDTTGTNETLLAYPQNTDNNVRVSIAAYQFPLGDKGTVYFGARGLALDDIADPLAPLSASGTGFVSNFGGESSQFFPVAGAGLGVSYKLTNQVQVALGYLGNDGSANNPADKFGLFNGAYGALGQIKFSPTSNFDIAFTYVRTYFNSASGVDLTGSTGTQFAIAPFTNSADPNTSGDAVATTTNTYGIQFQTRVGNFLSINGWGGYNQAIANVGIPGLFPKNAKADVWYYGLDIGFLDFGKPGNVLGFAAGVPPYVAGSDNPTRRNGNSDRNIHLEAFYRYKVNDYITVTPGFFYIINPESNGNNSDIYVGVLRTTFSF